MKRPYITRKNLIAIAIATLYAVLFVFVGLCLTATKDTVIAETNMFLAMAESFGFAKITLESGSGTNSLINTGTANSSKAFSACSTRPASRIFL